jgi:predicted molibdopterin-dependent oxidoreductase YjgC
MRYQSVLTICPFCGVGCGIHLQVMDGAAIGVLPARSHPVSEGRLCAKGWNAHAFLHRPDRLTRPLARENGELKETSWGQALDIVADRLDKIRAGTGSDTIGVLSSAKCTNEENYLLQKLARGALGTNNIDHCARL